MCATSLKRSCCAHNLTRSFLADDGDLAPAIVEAALADLDDAD